MNWGRREGERRGEIGDGRACVRKGWEERDRRKRWERERQRALSWGKSRAQNGP